jgi:hypothetical protein
MARITRSVLCLVVMLAALASVPVASGAQEGDATLIATGRVAFGMTDGEYVIWQEFDPDWQVPPTLYGARLDDREPFVIGHPQLESGYYERVHIAGGWVVWVETDSPVDPVRWSVHAMNLGAREAFEVAAIEHRLGSVVLSDGVVVWSETSGEQTGMDTIRGLDLATGKLLEIASGTGYISALSISGSLLVWQAQEGWYVSRLKARDIATMAPAETITTIRYASYGPGTRGAELMTVQGQRLFWHEGFDTFSDPYGRHTRVMTQRTDETAPSVLASGDQVRFAAAAGERVVMQDGILVHTIDLATSESVVLGHGTGVVTDGHYAFWHTDGLFGVLESPQLVGADLQSGSIHAFDIDGVARHVAGGVVVWTEGAGPERELHAARAEDMLPDVTQPQGPVPLQLPSWLMPLDSGTWNAASNQFTVPGAAGMPVLDLPWMVWSQDETPDDPNSWATDYYAFNLDTGERIALTDDEVDSGWYVDVADGVVLWDAWDSDTMHIRDLWTGETFAIDVTPSQSWTSPRVSRDWVVWVEFPPYSPENPNALGVMYAQGLWPGSERFIVSEASSSVAGLSGDLVAFIQPSAADLSRSELIVLNLASGETVYARETTLYLYPLDIEGSTLVYAEFASCYESMIGGCAEPHTISVVDLDSGETSTLRSHINTHEGGFPIMTDGRFILFQSWGGVGYDLLLERWFAAPGNTHSVKLDDGMLVWTSKADWERGPTNIHLAPAEEFSTGQHARYIEDVGHWVSFDMLTFWDRHGGQETFGAPLTEARSTNDAVDPQHQYTAQWFEYGRLELHPEHAGTPYEVQLGRLGAELLDSQGRGWLSFPKASPDATHYVQQTGHAIAPDFWEYWSSHGLEFGAPGVSWDESVSLFGYPISEPMLETNAAGNEVLTQYFERAVFELHSENDDANQVVLRQIGLEALLGP